MSEVLYKKIVELANFTEDDKVIDAYCGIGTISLMLAKRVKEVLGIEVVKEAIDNAKDNAKLNNIKNAKFKVGPAEELVEKHVSDFNALVVDPPRKGMDQKLIDTILKTKFEKVV
jgi:23S rRNA (uracil1939-C5)-methyltransferase